MDKNFKKYLEYLKRLSFKLNNAYSAYQAFEAILEKKAPNIQGQKLAEENCKIMSNYSDFFITTSETLKESALLKLAHLFDDVGNALSLRKMIPGDQFLYSDSGDFSVELYYDQTPILFRVHIEIESGAEYDTGDTVERWKSKVSEAFKLPLDLMSKSLTIRSITGQSWALQRECAIEKLFYSLNKQGDKIVQTSDNEVDAFRHFVWNVLLAKEFGKENAEIITYNHELYWNFKANKNELTRANYMDLWNNKKGREYFENHPDKKPKELFDLALKNGDIITSLEQISQEIKNEMQKDLDEYVGKE